ncbi:MAG TPA: amidohydrolase [Candidatus Scybalocola faecipullorum]|nr:amidohydrolase [Candidatus Scybalocola faecipullorum]
MGKVLIKNAKAIVTCDVKDQVFYDCDMLIDGPKIAAIGKNIEADDAEIIHAEGKFVYPGLVNTHHHFFQTFVRNLTAIDYPNMLVMDWIDKIYRIFQKIDDNVIYYSSLTAMADLLKHGCTTAFDHQYCYTTSTGKRPVDRQMEAAAQLGIRYTAGRGGNTLERENGSSIPAPMVESTDEFIKDCERLIDQYHDPNPYAMQQIVIAPCQPINCYKDTFVESLKLARDKGVRLHTHLGEGESEGIKERYGVRSVEWCQQIGFLGEDVFVAHAWELTPDEYKVLAKTGTGISHCPAPAVLGGFPILDIKWLMEQGVLVSLGCDGSATNDSSNELDALRMAYLMQAYHTKARGGCASAYDMLKVATVNGAKMLGRHDLGSLEPEKGADLFMIDTDCLELAGALHDPKNLLARVGVTGPVWMTMVNGKVVYKDGHLTGVDEEKLAREGEEVCTKVLRDEFKSVWY